MSCDSIADMHAIIWTCCDSIANRNSDVCNACGKLRFDRKSDFGCMHCLLEASCDAIADRSSDACNACGKLRFHRKSEFGCLLCLGPIAIRSQIVIHVQTMFGTSCDVIAQWIAEEDYVWARTYMHAAHHFSTTISNHTLIHRVSRSISIHVAKRAAKELQDRHYQANASTSHAAPCYRATIFPEL